MPGRFLVIYSAWAEPRATTKAAIVLDDGPVPQLPFSYEPDTIGDDSVLRVIAVIDVSSIPGDPFVAMDDEEVRFNQAGLMILAGEPG